MLHYLSPQMFEPGFILYQDHYGYQLSENIHIENDSIRDLMGYLSVLCKDVLHVKRGLIAVTSQWTEENHRSTKAHTFRGQVVALLAIMRAEATSTYASPVTRILQIGFDNICVDMWGKFHANATSRY